MANPLAGHTNSYHTYSHDEALQGIAEAGYTRRRAVGGAGLDGACRPRRRSGRAAPQARGLRARAGQPVGALRPDDGRGARARHQGGALGCRVRHPDRQHRGRRPPVGGRERGRVPREHRGDGRRGRAGGDRDRPRDPRRHHGLGRRSRSRCSRRSGATPSGSTTTRRTSSTTPATPRSRTCRRSSTSSCTSI